jgi:hypothetical protein
MPPKGTENTNSAPSLNRQGRRRQVMAQRREQEKEVRKATKQQKKETVISWQEALKAQRQAELNARLARGIA